MLTVYVYNARKPADCFDLSYQTLDTFTDTALGILAHHKTAVLWFGYLEGWMLTPEDETKLRAVIRAFDCHVVTRGAYLWLATQSVGEPARINFCSVHLVTTQRNKGRGRLRP